MPDPRTGRCRWQSHATALASTLIVSLVAQGLVWSPALAATCEIPAAVARSGDRLAATTRASSSTPATGSSVIQVEGEAEPAAATAVATPVATPVQPAPDPVALLAEELTAVASLWKTCLTEGDAETVTQISSRAVLGRSRRRVHFPGRYAGDRLRDDTRPTRRQPEDATPTGDPARRYGHQVVGNQLLRAGNLERSSGERRATESVAGLESGAPGLVPRCGVDRSDRRCSSPG